MSITSATRTLRYPVLNSALAHVEVEKRVELDVRHRHLLRPYLDVFKFGDGLHVAFDKHNREGWCNPSYYPFVATLRRWLDEQGVEEVRSEWKCYSRNDLPAGKLDGLLLGGPIGSGVLEIKATLGDGEEAQSKHVCQLGGYLALQSAWSGVIPRARWGVLAYALPRIGAWKIHVFRNISPLIRSSAKLLAA